MERVNIIIPVHNRPAHTMQTIESLYKAGDRDLWTLTVVDDGSEGETRSIVNTLAQMYDFTSIRHDKAIGPGPSRNEAARAMVERLPRGEFIYHSDNDVFFTPGWLPKMLRCFEVMPRDIKVLGGSCHPYLQNKHAISLNPDMPGMQVGIKDAVSGYSQLMTWETWMKYGPFDETMRNADRKIMGSEDWAFCQKIIQDGFRVGSIEPEVVIPCGKTNTYGDPATGSETFKPFEGVMVK